ncbi:hypothetical protein PCC9214_05058 [Planktothrix tepida]|uniref:Peptidase S1 domain-containing protein n=2 Tax=Planktothrix TaxID=54304 RepID=A0A1J1LK78_9CYAN|nr:hypothetical protein PCC9214_05058 [Planktothrix tepida]CUR31993.1 conserved hypothetical protein [Planktothrix tepida PCC 9214]
MVAIVALEQEQYIRNGTNLMSISIFKKLNVLVSTIASTTLSLVGVFVLFDINNKAESIVTSGDPNDYIVKPGAGYNGVVSIPIKIGSEMFGCSGSLLSSGRHILTAAQCFDNPFTPGLSTDTTILFDLPTGQIGIKANKIYIHPNWKDVFDFKSIEGDLAILELASVAPEAAERYDIYRNTDEVGQVGVKVGYGVSGQGNQGFDVTKFPFGVKRFGKNLYESGGEIFNSLDPSQFVPGTSLAYDFDNGNPENDGFGSIGIPDLGLGLQEVHGGTSPGGPTFINGLIAGMGSMFFCLGSANDNYTSCSSPPDIDNILLNTSFGEFGVDTRVSTYASYIDDVLGGKIKPTKTVPEPNMIFGTILTLGAFVLHSRFKQRKDKTTQSS